MPHLTIVLSDETSKRLRRAAKRLYGARKGSISGIVEEAVSSFSGRLEGPKISQKFTALKEGRAVAEAETLRELSSQLKRLGVDPRDAQILSTTELKPIIRAGFRTKSA